MADEFDILLGKIDVKVPWVTEGDDYAIIRECYLLFQSRIIVLILWNVQSLATRVTGARGSVLKADPPTSYHRLPVDT